VLSLIQNKIFIGNVFNIVIFFQVPQLFVQGNYIGGGLKQISLKHQSGELQQVIERAVSHSSMD
jgi:glutaredoxin-related protein